MHRKFFPKALKDPEIGEVDFYENPATTLPPAYVKFDKDAKILIDRES